MSTQARETETINRSVTVDCAVEHAFATFTERINDWWPLAKHSIDWYETGTPAESVFFQGGAGGQVYERTSKGEELKWADVIAYEPPHRFVLAWSPYRDENRPKTEIEVTFIDDGGKTRVELVHRGWEVFGAEAAEAREGYSEGWSSLLADSAEHTNN